MIKTEKEKYNRLIEKTIKHLEKSGCTDIKADLEGYENPKSFSIKGKGLTVTPDIVATTPNGKTQYVEVGTKSEDPILLKSKWKFLNTLAEIKNRGFRIVTHRGHYSFTDKLLSQMNLSQTLLKL